MPELENGGVRLHYELSGDNAGNVLVLGNSLGSNLHMWDKVLPWFESRYRVVRFDTRGHGQSSAPPGPYSIEDLGRDVLALLNSLGVERVNFCGLSLGGMVAMWLGIHAQQRMKRLIIANTGARIGTAEMWDQRTAAVMVSGMDQLAEITLTRWFTQRYREQHPEEMETIRTMVATTDPVGYSGCCGVLRDTDLASEIKGISVPCLVIAGKHDPATPPPDGMAINQAVVNSQYVELDASHLSAWERAEEFGAEVVAFLTPGEDRHG
jgi:3-oxoadipate enol-lactonase